MGLNLLQTAQIQLVKIPQELTESELKDYSKHHRERWTITSEQLFPKQVVLTSFTELNKLDVQKC